MPDIQVISGVASSLLANLLSKAVNYGWQWMNDPIDRAIKRAVKSIKEGALPFPPSRIKFILTANGDSDAVEAFKKIETFAHDETFAKAILDFDGNSLQEVPENLNTTIEFIKAFKRAFRLELSAPKYSRRILIELHSIQIEAIKSGQSQLSEKVKQEIGDFLKNIEALKGSYYQLVSEDMVLNVLRCHGERVQPEFFRRSGPEYADFEAGFVVRHEQIDKIKASIEDNPTLMISGVAASGKTVVARTLAYDFINKGRSVFFLQLKEISLTPSRIDRIADHIKRMQIEAPDAVIIIEDAHLAAQEVNTLMGLLRAYQLCTIITTRPERKERLSESRNYLPDESIDLKPQDQVEPIIDLYVEKLRRKRKWTPAAGVVDRIFERCENNLWLLSFALKSLNENSGRKFRLAHIKAEVRQSLHDLGLFKRPRKEHLSTDLFIPILVSLSILYQFEIMTDENFLFEWLEEYGSKKDIKNALRELSILNEVICEEEQRFRLFYGLPHSVLAELYLKAFSDEDFADTKKFSIKYIHSQNATNAFELFNYPNSKNDGIIDKLSVHWLTEVNIQKLSTKMTKATSLPGPYLCLKTIYNRDPKISRDLLKSAVDSNLPEKFANAEFWSEPSWISTIYRLLYKRGLYLSFLGGCFELFGAIDKHLFRNVLHRAMRAGLAAAIVREQNLRYIGRCLEHIMLADADRTLLLELFFQLIEHGLISKITTAREFGSIGHFMTICNAVPSFARKLYEHSLEHGIANALARTDGLKDASKYLYAVNDVAPDLGKALCHQIIDAGFAINIAKTNDFEGLGNCIKAVTAIDSNFGTQLCRQAIEAGLAGSIAQVKDLRHIGTCINNVAETDKGLGEALLDESLELGLSKTICSNETIFDTSTFLRVIAWANEELGKKLCHRIFDDGFTDTIAETFYLFGVANCIDIFVIAGPEIGSELCLRVIKAGLAKKITDIENAAYAGDCIKVITNLAPHLGKELCRQAITAGLANTLAVADNLYYVGDCIKSVDKTDHSLGKMLCKKSIDSGLATTMAKNSDDDSLFACLEIVSDVDRNIGEALLHQVIKLKGETTPKFEKKLKRYLSIPCIPSFRQPQ